MVVFLPLLAGLSRPAAAQDPPVEPPNAAALLTTTAGAVSLRYEGRAILDGIVATDPGVRAEARTATSRTGESVTQMMKWTARGPGRLRVALTIHGSAAMTKAATMTATLRR